MAVPPGMAQHLADLISSLNPYANRPAPAPTGEMDIYARNSNPQIPPSGHPNQMMVEVDNKYPGEWNFKGQSHRLAKAARIHYHFPVLDPQDSKTVLYYVDDYLLIGFEGANGP